jgi:hypothetical protein
LKRNFPPIFGEKIYGILYNMLAINNSKADDTIIRKKAGLVNDACQHVIEELREQGLSDSNSIYLLDHGPVVQSRIHDPEIRNLNVWIG